MSMDEIKNELPDKIADILYILDFYNQIQTGQGLKILTPDQILSRFTKT